MTTRDFLFLMIIFPLAIIVGVVAFMGLQEMAMLDNMDELGAVFSHGAHPEAAHGANYTPLNPFD
jgi:hypothetical protein